MLQLVDVPSDSSDSTRKPRGCNAGGVVPSLRPTYAICPGDRIEVVVKQLDGGRALVVGKLDRVPRAAGGVAMRITMSDARVKTLLPAA